MNESNLTEYYPNQRIRIGFFAAWSVMLKNIIASRELIWQLFKRDFLLQYKKSFFGFTWLLASPLIGVASWVLLQLTGILSPGKIDIAFLPYVLLGSSLWGLFMGFYASAMGTLDAGAGFINQVKYPHEALLVKQTAQHLAGFMITFILNLIVLVLYKVNLPIEIILFPIFILPLFFIGGGIGLIMSVVNVVAPDIQRIFGVFLSFLFYATPIVYSSEVSSPFLQKVIEYNPLTYLIGGIRDLIIKGNIENFNIFLILSIASFIFFLFAWRLFFVSEDKAIEKMI